MIFLWSHQKLFGRSLIGLFLHYLFIIELLVYVYASQKQIEWEVGGVRSDCCNHSRQQYPGHMITFTQSDASIQVT